MSVYGKHAVGGAERSAEKSAIELARLGHQVSLVSLCASSDPSPQIALPKGLTHDPIALAQIYDPYGLDHQKIAVPVVQSNLRKALWHAADVYNPVMKSRLQALWNAQRPDLVITHTLQGFSVAAWQAAKKSGAALLHVIHDHALICPGTAMTRGPEVCDKPCSHCNLYSRARQFVSTSPDALVAPSRAVLNRHRQFGWFNDVTEQRVIENALLPDWPAVFTPLEVTTGRRLRFGFLGRLDQSKGLDTLLEAARVLTPDSFEIRLAGPGDPGAAIAFIAGHGLTSQIKLEGVVKAADFLQGIDVLVTPSRAQETFCNVVMEAACLGIPAIVSDRGALPERVDFGVSGWIVPAGDSQALAKAMQHCMDNRDQVAARGAAALETRPRYDPARQGPAWAAACTATIERHRASL